MNQPRPVFVRQFFVGQKFLGEAPAETHMVHGKYHAPHGNVYVCPYCGDAWARVRVPGQQYMIFSLPCEQHGRISSLEIPGALWLLWEPEFNDSIPLEALRREVLVTIAQLRKVFAAGLKWHSWEEPSES